MKKIFLIALVFILMCGCNSGVNSQVKLSDITFTAEILKSGKSYTVNGEINSEHILTATVTAPESLKGTCFTASNDTVNVQFLGISYDKKLKDFPAGAVINLLYKTSEDIINGDKTPKNGKINGKTGDTEYTFVFKNDGTPESLSVPSMNLKIKFSKVYLKDR